MKPLGKKNLMTCGSGSIKKIGLYDKVKELLAGFEIYELSDIQPNPKYDPSVLDGVRICKENGIEAILAVGGGSVGIDESRIEEMAHHIAVNEGLENAYVPLTEKDIVEILTASL